MARMIVHTDTAVVRAPRRVLPWRVHEGDARRPELVANPVPLVELLRHGLGRRHGGLGKVRRLDIQDFWIQRQRTFLGRFWRLEPILFLLKQLNIICFLKKTIFNLIC